MSTKKVTKHHGSSSILADHKKVGTRFLPPLAQLNMKAMRWVDRTMPELLWQGLLVDKYGVRTGMGLALSLAQAANETFALEGKRPFFATTSGYDEMTPEQQQETVVRLTYSDQLMPLQQGLLPILALYPECPLMFVMNSSLPKYDGHDGLRRVKTAVAKLYDKRDKPATLIIANAIYIGGLTGKIRYAAEMQVPNLEAVFDYPNTDESRKVASELRASVGMFTVMGEDAPPSWPSYFWNRGLELEPCDVDGVYETL